MTPYLPPKSFSFWWRVWFRQLNLRLFPTAPNSLVPNNISKQTISTRRQILNYQPRHLASLCKNSHCLGHLSSSPGKLNKVKHSRKGRDSRIAQPIPVAIKGETGSPTEYTNVCVCVCVSMTIHPPRRYNSTTLHKNRNPSIKTRTDEERSLRITVHSSQPAVCWAPNWLLLRVPISYHVSFTSSQRNMHCHMQCCNSCTVMSFIHILLCN